MKVSEYRQKVAERRWNKCTGLVELLEAPWLVFLKAEITKSIRHNYFKEYMNEAFHHKAVGKLSCPYIWFICSTPGFCLWYKEPDSGNDGLFLVNLHDSCPLS